MTTGKLLSVKLGGFFVGIRARASWKEAVKAGELDKALLAAKKERAALMRKA